LQKFDTRLIIQEIYYIKVLDVELLWKLMHMVSGCLCIKLSNIKETNILLTDHIEKKSNVNLSS